ncbi:MAG: hypothetical protein WC584_05165 [Candidatus Pacearchaeota archaeon]
MVFLDFLEKIAKNAMYKFVEGIENGEDRIIYKIKKSVIDLQKRFILNMLGSLIILVSLIFISLSLVFLLIEYFLLTKTLALGIIGLILLILGIIIKLRR